ncbi:MAG: dihydrolipoyl dehydrogenase family protein, partial [Hyphomicrobium sp.]
ITARRFVIATGSSPFIPNIAGIDKVPYLTNENIFELPVIPSHLIIIGGGPIGLEMAQAYCRLGSRVTVCEAFKVLSKDDEELAQRLMTLIRGEGVEIYEKTSVERVEQKGSGVLVHVKAGQHSSVIEGSHLLVAAGRRANVSDLNLDAAGVTIGKSGIEVDRSLRTKNKKIYAIGDVIGGLQFTHVANYHASVILKRILFRLPSKVKTHAIPWVTFTEPELAHVGLREQEAQAANPKEKIRVLRWPFHENDRAQAESTTDGHLKVIVDHKGRLLGASLLGPHAGELIQMWALALSQNLPIKAFVDWISPYPTLSEISKRAAFRFYTDKANSPFVRRLVRLLAKFG